MQATIISGPMLQNIIFGSMQQEQDFRIDATKKIGPMQQKMCSGRCNTNCVMVDAMNKFRVGSTTNVSMHQQIIFGSIQQKIESMQRK